MPEFDYDAALAMPEEPAVELRVPACLHCQGPLRLTNYDSSGSGYTVYANCDACHAMQNDYWHVVACTDHGSGSPNLLLDRPGGEANAAERYRRIAFCPYCGEESLEFERGFHGCDEDGSLGENETDYDLPGRCVFVECRDCHAGWKEIYALRESLDAALDIDEMGPDEEEMADDEEVD